MVQINTSLSTLLHKHGYRATAARQSVFGALEQSQQPLFMHEITKRCGTIDRTSIYRTLLLYERLGIVQTIQTGFKKRYELAGPFTAHHHHFICDHCGALTDIHTPNLEHLISDLSREYAFRVNTHHFELHGSCKNCTYIVQQ